MPLHNLRSKSGGYAYAEISQEPNYPESTLYVSKEKTIPYVSPWVIETDYLISRRRII